MKEKIKQNKIDKRNELRDKVKSKTENPLFSKLPLFSKKKSVLFRLPHKIRKFYKI